MTESEPSDWTKPRVRTGQKERSHRGLATQRASGSEDHTSVTRTTRRACRWVGRSEIRPEEGSRRAGGGRCRQLSKENRCRPQLPPKCHARTSQRKRTAT